MEELAPERAKRCHKFIAVWTTAAFFLPAQADFPFHPTLTDRNRFFPIHPSPNIYAPSSYPSHLDPEIGLCAKRAQRPALDGPLLARRAVSASERNNLRGMSAGDVRDGIPPQPPRNPHLVGQSRC